MNFIGIIVGFFTFFIIGLFHPLVIKGEYYWGVKSWYAFLVMGIVFTLLSLWIENPNFSIVCGVVAFSSFWSIIEVFEQRERVVKGWFPMNPKRKAYYAPFIEKRKQQEAEQHNPQQAAQKKSTANHTEA